MMAFWSKKSTTEGEQPAGSHAGTDGLSPPQFEQPYAPPPQEAQPLTPDQYNAAPAPDVPPEGPQETHQEAPALSPEEAQQRAAHSKKLLMSFGEIVSVMMRSPQFRNASLADLEKLVVPAVVSGQFIVAEAQSKSSGFVTPVGVVIWATVSDEIDQRIMATPDQPIQLENNEWRSGDNPWLIALLGDSRVVQPMLEQVHHARFQDRPLKMRARNQDGTYRITEFRPAQRAS
jgi:hemolysin-activating ACP:hemolysin acyltransferase